MQSSGGSISARAAASEPVRTILSGPAGGVVGATRAARRGRLHRRHHVRHGRHFDRRGAVRGRPAPPDERGERGGTARSPCPCSTSTRSARAAGRSRALTRAAVLRVGPQSAGADPGPACYGRSTLPTVTDANLVLGRFGGADLLGGEFKLDEERALEALAVLAREMTKACGREVKAVEAALGVVRVVNAGMERALRAVSVERGYDPRVCTLVTFGGAGGLARGRARARSAHPARRRAARARRALGSRRLRAGRGQETRAARVMLEAGATAPTDARRRRSSALFRRWSARHAPRSGARGSTTRSSGTTRTVAARYRGQSFELEVAWEEGRRLVERFHRAHEARYGYAQSADTVEVVSARLRSAGLVEESKAARPRRDERHARLRQTAPRRCASTSTTARGARPSIDARSCPRARVCVRPASSRNTLRRRLSPRARARP